MMGKERRSLASFSDERARFSTSDTSLPVRKDTSCSACMYVVHWCVFGCMCMRMCVYVLVENNTSLSQKHPFIDKEGLFVFSILFRRQTRTACTYTYVCAYIYTHIHMTARDSDLTQRILRTSVCICACMRMCVIVCLCVHLFVWM